jgi:hypothetical protein
MTLAFAQWGGNPRRSIAPAHLRIVCVRRLPTYSLTKKVGVSAPWVMIVSCSENGSSDGTSMPSMRSP